MIARLGMTACARCCALWIVVAAVMTGFGAAGAAASPLTHLRERLLARHAFAGMLQKPVYLEPSASLDTAPVKVTIDGTTYMMEVHVSQDLTTAGLPPTIVVSLYRDVGTHRPGFQEHDYTFSPGQGITFTHDRKGRSATVTATSAIAPSSISLTYTSTQSIPEPCTLRDGSKGKEFYSEGKVTVSSFTFASGTSPFFGTITTKPKQATFFYEPGCRTDLKLERACVKTEVIQVGTFSSPRFWFFGDYLGDPTAEEGAWDTTANADGTQIAQHLADDRVTAADLLAPTVTPTGATATIKTKGDAFMTGTATFTSTSPPKTSTGTCHDTNGDRHTVTMSTYTGTLASGSPLLSVNFDTGPFQLSAPVTAKLGIPSYG